MKRSMRGCKRERKRRRYVCVCVSVCVSKRENPKKCMTIELRSSMPRLLTHLGILIALVTNEHIPH